jgi:PmbA protein
MEKLLKIAATEAEQADLYYTEDSSDSISFNDGKLDKADSSLSSGLSLRMIKNERVGFAHTRNLLDPQALVKQAIISSESGIEAKYQLPMNVKPQERIVYDPTIEQLNKKELIRRGNEMISYIKARSDAQFNLSIWYGTGKSELRNTAGADLSRMGSSFGVYAQMVFPGTGSGLYTYKTGVRECWISNEELDELISLYDICQTQIVPPTGKFPVIFHPHSLYTLLWRIDEAINPANILSGISPLSNREGEKVFSEKLTYWQNPLDTELSSATAFDDEGTPTRTLHFIENGVFKAIPMDLFYAKKLGKEATGNGFRSSIESMPGTTIINAIVSPGSKSLKEMIASIDHGLIVYSLMGAHSGNILSGEYSVGVSSGLLIKDGKAVGRVKDCMLSGNIYESLQNIVDIESVTHRMGSRKMPAVLLDGISVAGK